MCSVCLFQMNTMCFTLILGSLLISHSFSLFTSENVVFQKTNEIFINDAHWSVTFVHDLRPFENLINQISNDLHHTDSIVKTITDYYQSSNLTGYVETFKSLHIEIDILTETYTSLFDNFGEYEVLSQTQRSQRSLLPIIGKLMSSLFGTVSEDDLDNINRNIRNLASNQEQIIHDLDVSLSVLNLTRMQVAENRRSIMDLIIVVQKLDRSIMRLQETFERKFVRLEQFIHTYLQFQLILDEIRLTTQDGITYLENLKSELNMLSMHHLSTSTISPQNLKMLLIEVESKLPNNFELPRNPRKDIWYFYKTLTCITYLEDNEIRIVLKIPLLNTKEEYEVYKIHNLPLPLISNNTVTTNSLVKYSLETDLLMVSKDRSKFSLLSENTYQMCNTYHLQYCNPETAYYQTNLNKFCVMALFTQNKHEIKTLCKQMIILDQVLPTTKYLFAGVWIIVTDKPLMFTVNCQINKNKVSDIKVKSPFDILKLNNTCKAYNKYLQLPEYFDKHSAFERTEPLKGLLKLHNISQFVIWNVSKTEFEKLKPVNIPSHLKGLKEIPMQTFLRETRAYKTIQVDDNKNNSHWAYAIVVAAALSFIIISIICLVTRKSTCNFSQIIGKRRANVYDLENVNVKCSPSHGVGEEIEMSAMIDKRNVNYSSEGQKPFKRTDASLAWPVSKFVETELS